MRIYLVYIRENYKEKLSNEYVELYIPKNNFYGYTTNKNIIDKFKKERNTNAFIFKKVLVNKVQLQSYLDTTSSDINNRELKKFSIMNNSNREINIISTNYEISYINELYSEYVLVQYPYEIYNFNYSILKHEYRIYLDMILMTLFIEYGNPDDDIKEKYADMFESGILPNGYVGITGFNPNQLNILCNEFKYVFNTKG